MFEAAIRDAKSAVNSVLERVVERAIVTVAFAVALAFVTAAATMYLSELYGARTAYLILAGVFATFGIVAAIAVHSPPIATTADADASGAAGAGEANVNRPGQSANSGFFEMPADLASVAALIAGNPGIAWSGARFLLRNVTLLLLVGLMATLLLSERSAAASQTGAPPGE